MQINILALSILSKNPAIALFVGIFFSVIRKIPQDFFSRKIGSKILQIAIVILGASISLPTVIGITSSYFLWVSCFVVTTFAVGIGVGKLLGLSKQGYLLASGAAICGGTAMAALAPIIKAKPEELASSMAIIFLLNALNKIFKSPNSNS